MHGEVSAIAAREGRSLSNLLRKLILEALDHRRLMNGQTADAEMHKMAIMAEAALRTLLTSQARSKAGKASSEARERKKSEQAAA